MAAAGVGARYMPAQQEEVPLVEEAAPVDLPAWAGFPLNNGECQLGPSLMWLRALVVALILMQATFFVLVKLSAACPEEHGGALPTYPLWVWTAAVPCLLLRNYVEWHALVHFLPFYVRVVRMVGLEPFKVLGVGVPFWLWAAFYVLCSNLNFTDVGTDSLFTGVVIKAEECLESQVAEVWRKTMAQSIFGRLGVQAVSLSSVATAIWLISFLQMVWPLIQTLGRGCCRDEKLGEWGNDIGLLSCSLISNTEKFGDLSEAAGLATAQSAWTWCGSCSSGSYDARGELKDPDWLIGYAAGVVRQLFFRFVFTFVFENALQLNVQTTVFAIQCSLTKDEFTLSQTQTLVSIGITISLSFLKLMEAKSCLDYIRLIDGAIADHEPDKEDYAALLRQYRRCKWGIAAAWVIMVLTLLYATCKLIGTFVCKDSMLNITGCVDLSVY